MSRIWKLPIVLPSNVEVSISDNVISAKWPLWELKFDYSSEVEISKSENNVVVKPLSQSSNAIWWTTRSIVENMVIWVSAWFKKSLEINWVWYKFELAWDNLILSIWYSHKVEVKVPAWLKASLDEKEKNVLHITWVDKQKLWEFASKIKFMKKPEPYKGKWIKYVWEQIRRKAWKTGAK